MDISTKRIHLLFDDESFIDHYSNNKSHFICGEGTINSVKTFLVMNRGQDAEFHECGQWQTAGQIINTITHAYDNSAPLVYIQDRLGKADSRFESGQVLSSDMSKLLLSPKGMGRVSALLAELTQKNLLISAILGPTSGPLALPLMLADLVLMTKKGALCMGRPDMVKAMLGQTSDLYSLGGADVHSKASGAVQLVFEDEAELFRCVRRVFENLFQIKLPCQIKYDEPDRIDIKGLIPAIHSMPYDIHNLVSSFIDKGSLIELSPDFAMEVLTAFVNIKGKAALVVANNPKYGGGVIHPRTVVKMVKAINISAKFNLPLAFIADIPGFMIGKEAEQNGIFSAAAELFQAHVRCKVSKLLLVVRKAYTGGVYAMGGGGFEPIATLAYPQTHIGVFGVETMKKILSHSTFYQQQKDIATELSREISSPQLLEEKGLITEVIDPTETREKIHEYLFRKKAD